MSKRYHLRFTERDMPRWEDQLEVIRGQRFMTLAMCDGGEPYMVAMNHVYVEEDRSFYLHCAAAGRKIECLRAGGRVYGMIIEDNGYVAGKCSYRYRSVAFSGTAAIVEGEAAKRRALERLIDAHEPDAETCKQRMLTVKSLESIVVLQIKVDEFSGKQSPAKPA